MSKKKENLLEHAEQLFYEYGFHAVGLKRIITEADVALMTMYNHFDSKEDLVLQVLKRRDENYFLLLKSSLMEDNSCHNALLFAKAHNSWLQSYGSNGCLLLRAKEEYPSYSEINDFVISHKERVIAFFQENGLNQNEAIRLAMLFEGATALAEVMDVIVVSKELLTSTKSLFHL